MNPFEPPETETTKEPRMSRLPDDFWLHPFEKMIAILTGLVLILFVLLGIYIAWRSGLGFNSHN